MIYKLETSLNGSGPHVFRMESSRKLKDAAEAIADAYQLDLQSMFVDVANDENIGYTEEEIDTFRYAVLGNVRKGYGMELLDASLVNVGHVLSDLGSMMMIHAGYDEIVVRLKGITFE